MRQPHDDPGRFAPSIRREHLPMHTLNEDQFDAALAKWLVIVLTALIALTALCVCAAYHWMDTSRG